MADTLKPRSIKTLKQLRERIRNGTGKRYSNTVSVDDQKKTVTNKMWGAAIEHLARAHVKKRKSMDWGFVACIDAESCASATAANQALTNAGLDPSADRILAVNFGPPECIARMRTNVEDNGIATVLPVWLLCFVTRTHHTCTRTHYKYRDVGVGQSHARDFYQAICAPRTLMAVAAQRRS